MKLMCKACAVSGDKQVSGHCGQVIINSEQHIMTKPEVRNWG